MSSNRLNNKRVSQSRNRAVQLPLILSNGEEISDIYMLEKLLAEATAAIKEVVNPYELKLVLLPLLFYKYISDSSDPPLITSKSLTIPTEYRWEAILSHQTDETVGQFITRAIHYLTSLNPTLQGILNFKHYENFDDIALKRLIGVISQYRLSFAHRIGLWGDAYEYLLAHFPEEMHNDGEPLYTPRDVVKLMIRLVDPEPGERFYDPACGSGCLSGLFHCLDLNRAEQEVKTMLIGQGQSSIASAVARMDLFFYDNAEINQCDALYEPLAESNKFKRFRYIFVNPPWNQPGYDETFYKRDSYGRFQYGIPPRKSADWGWIQHILASLEENKGQAAVILDLGALSRGSGNEPSEGERNIRKAVIERDIRKALIEQDVIEAVISLPGNLFYNTTAPCSLLLLNVNKMPARKGQILFVDMLNTFETRRSSKRVGLKPEECDAIVEAYSQWKTVENFSCVTPLEETRSYDSDLSPALYVPKEMTMYHRPLDAIQQELAEAVQKRISSDIKILEHLNCQTEKEFHLVDILNTYLPGLRVDRLDKTLRILVNNATKCREQELALEIEQRETVSHDLFVFEAEIVRLGTCTYISSGFTPAKPKRERDGQRVPWVKAGDLEQELVVEAEGSLPEIITTNDPHSRYAIRPVNTILLALYGGTSTVGKTAILGISAATNQSVCCITPFNEAFDNAYLFCYLTYIRKSWMRYAQGSRQNIYLQVVKNRSIPRPDPKQQEKIVAELRPHNERICELKREIAVLRQILKA